MLVRKLILGNTQFFENIEYHEENITCTFRKNNTNRFFPHQILVSCYCKELL